MASAPLLLRFPVDLIGRTASRFHADSRRRSRVANHAYACVSRGPRLRASLLRRAQREQRERSAVRVGPPQTSGRAGGSLTLRFYFLRSFLPPSPRARATPLFLDTRGTVVRRPSRERTPTLARTDCKNRLSPFPVRPLIPSILSRNSFCSFFPFAADEADGRSPIGEMSF